ncbi:MULTISPECIES: transporter [unclassified Mucilaginibacter]|uniref:transporter n=1 Tax=unclassified Mucilaginibacter TaxID=2617802 RepID=UPI0031F6DBC0
MNQTYFFPFLVLSLCCASFVSTANAQALDTTRKSYSIFKPMPKQLEREEMETDRPNVTETPHTVDAGHFQYETDLVKLTRETTEESKQRRWLVNQANLKFGLLKNTALQVIVQSYGKETNTELIGGDKETMSGFGNITVRLKQCLFNNYEGTFSMALMPYVKFPTNRYSDQQKYEEGLLVPMLIKLPHDWKIGLQVEGDYMNDEDEQARHAELLQSFVISHVLFKKLEVFGETFYTYNFKEHKMNNFINTALELEITPDFKVDAGLNYGIQKSAHKDYFVGLAFRY